MSIDKSNHETVITDCEEALAEAGRVLREWDAIGNGDEYIPAHPGGKYPWLGPYVKKIKSEVTA